MILLFFSLETWPPQENGTCLWCSREPECYPAPLDPPALWADIACPADVRDTVRLRTSSVFRTSRPQVECGCCYTQEIKPGISEMHPASGGFCDSVSCQGHRSPERTVTRFRRADLSAGNRAGSGQTAFFVSGPSTSRRPATAQTLLPPPAQHRLVKRILVRCLVSHLRIANPGIFSPCRLVWFLLSCSAERYLPLDRTGFRLALGSYIGLPAHRHSAGWEAI